MDYASLHGPGISNFSSSSPHRMPTVSAAQALKDLKSAPSRCISTGLELLDHVLLSRDLGGFDAEGVHFHGGIERGKVMEVYGPPGVGKTAFGIQIAVNALCSGEGVVWVDASHPLPGPRLNQVLSANLTEPQTLNSLLQNLTHFSTPTLSHLLALLSLPSSLFPPQNTSLIVIDSFSTLINNAFPRIITNTTQTPGKRNANNAPRTKHPLLSHLLTTLTKLSTTLNLSILLLTHCNTKMRPGSSALLVPSLNTTSWEQGISCRIVLFRDWGWEDENGEIVEGVRFCDVVKNDGGGRKGALVGFRISESGLQSLTLPTIITTTYTPSHHPHPHPFKSPPSLPLLPQKRKLSQTELEIPDSEGEEDDNDEDYGWAEEDEEELPPAPPQWQGSEDIFLVPDQREQEVEEDGDELGEGMGDIGGGERGKRAGGEGGRGVREGRREEIEDSEDELA